MKVFSIALVVLALAIPAFAADTTPLYVKGLVMVDTTHPDMVRLCLPSAPNHKPTLTVLPLDGSKQTLTVKGNGQLISATPHAGSVALPADLIRMREIYGNTVKARLDGCPSVINIPAAAIRSVSTSEVSKARYTFVRVDSGKEVETFRPRQVAMEIKLELDSPGVLAINGRSIPLNTVRELRLEYLPEHSTVSDPFIDHFHSYLAYVERPAALDFDVVPKNLNYSSSPTPKVGNHFAPLDNIVFCYLIAVP